MCDGTVLNDSEIHEISLLFKNDPFCSPVDSVIYESRLKDGAILFTSKPDLNKPVFFLILLKLFMAWA